MGIRIEGDEYWDRELGQVPDEIEERAQDSIEEGAEDIADRARHLVPFDTGQLYYDIETGSTKGEAWAGVDQQLSPYAGAVHGLFVPYLTGASDDEETGIVRRFESEMEDVVRHLT